MSEESTPVDMSAGQLSPERKTLDAILLADAAKKSGWQSFVFWSSVVVIASFYGVAIAIVLYWVFCHPPVLLELEHGLILALLLAVPSLLAIQLFKLVDPHAGMTASDWESHPFVKLVKETAALFAKKP